MNRRLALNLATLYPASFERKLHAAEAAGFRAVGLLSSEMARGGAAAITELRLSELAVAEIVGVSGWADLDLARRSLALAQAERAFDLAALVQASLVVASPPQAGTESALCAHRFRELCDLALPYRARVGLEFSGSAESVRDVATAWEVVDMAGAANGGLVIDLFHFYKGGSRAEMLEPVPGHRLFLVQLCDCPEMPGYELENRHRVYPGEGAIPLQPLLARLSEKGYDGYLSLELFNEQYWAADPLVVAKDAMRSLRRLI